MTMTRLLALLALGLSLSACGDDAPVASAPETALVPEADVERFRTDLFLETNEVDAEIARFEGEAVGADSATASAYEDALSRLRGTRRDLQARIDSLQPVPAAEFDSTRRSLVAAIGDLRESIDRARFNVALTGPALQDRARSEIARLDDVFAALRADTTRAAARQLDSLTVRRARLTAGLDTLRRVPPERVDAARLVVVRAVDALRRDVEAARPDTSAVEPTPEGTP